MSSTEDGEHGSLYYPIQLSSFADEIISWALAQVRQRGWSSIFCPVFQIPVSSRFQIYFWNETDQAALRAGERGGGREEGRRKKAERSNT